MRNRKGSSRKLLSAAAAVLLVLGANSAVSAAPFSLPTPTLSAADASTTAALTAEQRRLAYVKLVQQIQRQTEQIYGKALGQPIHANILDDKGLSDLLKKLLAEELKKPEAQGSEQVMKFLQLLPADVPLEQIYQALMEGQVGGLYNPSDKSLYVVGTYAPEGLIGQIILSHEIGHAIQDASFNLTKYLEDETQLDRQKAKQCVTEGDATVLMIDWGSKYGTMASLFGSLTSLTQQMSAGLDTAPPAIVQDMVFSYLQGAKFCQAAQIRFGDKWRDQVFLYPPVSTEQVLHPAKYTGKVPDLPETVTLPKAPKGWTEIYRNTFGEWTTRLFLTPPAAFPKITMFSLDPTVNEPIASAAAAGWDGDEVLMLTQPEKGEKLLVWKSVWDSEKDAKEFESAVQRRLKLFPEFSVGGKAHYELALKRQGQKVGLVLATSRAARDVGVQLLSETARGAK